MTDPRLILLLLRAGRLSLFAAICGAVLSVVGALLNPVQFFQSWLFAWLFFAGLSFGSLVIIMMQAVTGGAWGVAIRRPAEAAMLTLPLMALLFVPILIGASDIFPWLHRAAHAASDSWEHRRGYLNLPSFTARAVLYFAVTCALAFPLRRWSLMQDKKTEPALAAKRTKRTERLSSGGLVAYVLCMNFASTDWVMSLEPTWYSTIFVIVFMAGQFLSALAFMTAIVTLFGGYEPFSSKLTTKHVGDLGNMLLAFVIFWIYVSFSQFLIIWSGNLPKEISWYLHRSAPSWKGMEYFLLAVQFLIPFALLIQRSVSRNRPRLCAVAILIVVANLATVYWHVAPAFHPEGIHLHWLDLVALITVGGFWKLLFIRFLKAEPLWPNYPDPEA